MAHKKRQKPKTKKPTITTTPSKAERSGHLLAPAPGRVLFGVVIFTILGFWFAAQFRNDYVAVAICTAVMCAAWVCLEFSGREAARRHPNPLYLPNRLPTDHSKLRAVVIAMTIVALIVFISVTVQPDEKMSAFPFFLTAGFLFLVLPQLLAQRVVRRAERAAPKTE